MGRAAFGRQRAGQVSVAELDKQAERAQEVLLTCCLGAARWLAVERLLGGLEPLLEMADTTRRLPAGNITVR